MPPTQTPQTSLTDSSVAPAKKGWFVGRINRKTYLLGILIVPVGCFLIGIILSVPLFFVARSFGSSATPNSLALPIIVIAFILAIPAALFGTSLGVRRLHDIGFSGWYLLVPTFLYVLSLISRLVSSSSLLSTVLYLFVLIFSFFLLLKGGSASANAYGSPQDVGAWRGIWNRGLTK